MNETQKDKNQRYWIPDPLSVIPDPRSSQGQAPIGDPASFAATNETQQRQRPWIPDLLSVIPDIFNRESRDLRLYE